MSDNRITKSEIIEELSERLDLSVRQSKRTVNELLELVAEKLVESPDNRVSLHGFGTFEICNHSSRRGVDPRDHDREIEIPSRSVPKFRAGKTLKRKVRKAFDQDS